MIYFFHYFFQNFKLYSFISAYIEFLEELGYVEGMESFVGCVKNVDKLLFFVLDFDVAEECGKVVFEGEFSEDEELFQVVENDSGAVGQSYGQASLHIIVY